MTRRTYIKFIFAVGGITSTSLFLPKWFNQTRLIREEEIWERRTIIAELVETIIPASNTPGAKMASVHDYIIRVILNCRKSRDQRNFLSGVDQIEALAKRRFGIQFIDCDVSNRHQVLQHFSDKERHSHPFLSRIRNKILGKSFFSELRDLTVEGYCQSRLGATQGLAYDHIPGSFESCTSLNPGQKSWATK
jgi:hypothetical protein